MLKHLLLFLLVLRSAYSLGQSNNEKVDRLVDMVCDCTSKAKDNREFELCERMTKPADTLSDAQKFYFLKKLIGQCNDALERFWGPRRDSLKIQPCLYLQPEDAKDYNLRKSMSDDNSIYWSGTVTGQVLKELTDERRKFESETLAAEYLDKQRKLTQDEGIKGIKLSIENLQSAEAFNFGDVGGYYLYHVYAQKGKLVCFLVVSITRDDIGVIKNLLDRVSTRVRTCK